MRRRKVIRRMMKMKMKLRRNERCNLSHRADRVYD